MTRPLLRLYFFRNRPIPNDPVNWSSKKKHLILLTVAWGALCVDFTSAAGTATIFLQGAEWHMSPTHVNYAKNLNVLMMYALLLITSPVFAIFTE
jgi:hypothetical protein